jgi:hypothetical protein
MYIVQLCSYTVLCVLRTCSKYSLNCAILYSYARKISSSPSNSPTVSQRKFIRVRKSTGEMSNGLFTNTRKIQSREPAVKFFSMGLCTQELWVNGWVGGGRRGRKIIYQNAKLGGGRGGH